MDALPASFGKYFLTEKIATGGMAEIFLGKLIGPGGFEKQLVIKKIHPRLSASPVFVDLFVAEAKTLVSLSHGNIVPIYELGMVGESYFIAMEYIDGPTLEELSRATSAQQRGMAPSLAAYICGEVLKGLDYAHRKGQAVIHRDVSPRNVMLSRDGEVKVVDFGISLAGADGRGDETGDDGPTGSYPHMSPEQARGQALDARSDLFAVGILLWELVAGRALFARDSDSATLEAVTSADIPRIFSDFGLATPELDEILVRALARDPGARFQSASEFLGALQQLLYRADNPVTAATIASLVACTCPPELANTSSGIDTTKSAATNRSGTVPIDRARDVGPEGTRPMPRGKQRPERSFATHAAFERDLAKTQSPVDHDATGVGSSSAEQTAEVPPVPTRSSPPVLVALLAATALLAVGLGVALVWPTFSEAPARAPAAGVPEEDAGALAVAPLQDSSAGGPVRASADAAAVESVPEETEDEPQKSSQKNSIGKKVIAVKDAAPTQDRLPGSVRIGVNPWADVSVDGKSVGRAPGVFRLPPGRHEIRLERAGYSAYRTVEVKPGESVNLGLIELSPN